MSYKFNIRVVLHEATAHDYLRVHAALKAQGVDDLITADSGAVYRLPPGEYACSLKENYSVTAVRDFVEEIVKPVYPSFAIRVSKTTASAWQGLKQVSPAPTTKGTTW